MTTTIPEITDRLARYRYLLASSSDNQQAADLLRELIAELEGELRERETQRG